MIVILFIFTLMFSGGYTLSCWPGSHWSFYCMLPCLRISNVGCRCHSLRSLETVLTHINVTLLFYVDLFAVFRQNTIQMKDQIIAVREFENYLVPLRVIYAKISNAERNLEENEEEELQQQRS